MINYKKMALLKQKTISVFSFKNKNYNIKRHKKYHKSISCQALPAVKAYIEMATARSMTRDIQNYIKKFSRYHQSVLSIEQFTHFGKILKFLLIILSSYYCFV